MNKLQQILKELQGLNPQDPGSWPTYVHIIAMGFLMVLIAIGGFVYFVQPELDDLTKVQAEEPGLKQEFEAKQHKVAALDAYKDQLAEMERSFGTMLRQLPSKTEIANLLIDISQTRLASNLEEELFQPQGETPKEFYAEVPNKIIVIGDYHAMGAFVSGVAALPRIVTIEDVDIKSAAGTSGRSKLRMAAMAKTYRYLDESEIAAGKPKAAAKAAPAKK